MKYALLMDLAITCLIALAIGQQHDCEKHLTGNPSHWGNPEVIAKVIRKEFLEEK